MITVLERRPVTIPRSITFSNAFREEKEAMPEIPKKDLMVPYAVTEVTINGKQFVRSSYRYMAPDSPYKDISYFSLVQKKQRFGKEAQVYKTDGRLVVEGKLHEIHMGTSGHRSTPPIDITISEANAAVVQDGKLTVTKRLNKAAIVRHGMLSVNPGAVVVIAAALDSQLFTPSGEDPQNFVRELRIVSGDIGGMVRLNGNPTNGWKAPEQSWTNVFTRTHV